MDERTRYGAVVKDSLGVHYLILAREITAPTTVELPYWYTAMHVSSGVAHPIGHIGPNSGTWLKEHAVLVEPGP